MLKRNENTKIATGYINIKCEKYNENVYINLFGEKCWCNCWKQCSKIQVLVLELLPFLQHKIKE